MNFVKMKVVIVNTPRPGECFEVLNTDLVERPGSLLHIGSELAINSRWSPSECTVLAAEVVVRFVRSRSYLPSQRWWKDFRCRSPSSRLTEDRQA